MANKAYITAKVFKWARESAKMTEEIAASKVAVPIDRFKEWENGDAFPSISQAQITHFPMPLMRCFTKKVNGPVAKKSLI